MPDFPNLDDAAAQSWLADISGYLRARIALAQEYTALDAPRRAIPLVWLDRMVGTADDLAALEQWRFVADVRPGVPGPVGMRVVGRGDALDAPLRNWLRGNEAPRSEELRPGEVARATGGDLGASVLVGPDELKVAWFVTGDLGHEVIGECGLDAGVWTSIVEWSVRHDATLVELGRTPAAFEAVDHVVFRLAGSDRKERLLDALELYGSLDVEQPRHDVLTAFMNHDLGEIGLRVACGNVGVVEMGLVGDTAGLAPLVLVLDDFGGDTVEHVARLQGVMDSEPARIIPKLGQHGPSVELQYDLSAYRAVDSDEPTR